MDNKFLKIIGAVFVVLVVIASFPIIGNVINNKKKQTPKNISVDLSGFNKSNVEKISIKKGSDEKVLSSVDGVWKIGSDEADSSKVDELFQEFEDLKIKETASQNQDNQAKFETSKDLATVLTITQGGKDSVYYVGKVAGGGQDFYLRKDGIVNTYLVSGLLRDKLTQAAEKWKKTEEKK